MRTILIMVAATMSLTACTTSKTIVWTPPVPAALLSCPDEPKPGTIKKESDLVDWVEDVRHAGNVCRENLKAVDKALK